MEAQAKLEAAANRKGSVMLKGNMNADLANKLVREGKIDHALATYNSIDLSVANDDLRFQVKNNVGAIHMQRGQVSEEPDPGPDMAVLQGAELSFVQAYLAFERVERRDRHMAARHEIRRSRQARESHSGWPWSAAARAIHEQDLTVRFGPRPYGPAPEFCPEDFRWDEQWTAADEAWYQLESGEAGGSPPPSDSSETENSGSDEEI